MRVSVRLKGLWATALVASMMVGPSMAFGQNEFSPTPSAQSQPAASLPGTQMNSADAEAKRLLLKARQALANDDVQTSQSLMDAAAKLAVDYKSLGDSPATVGALIQRRTQLVEMAQAQDPNYNVATASYFLVQAEALIHYQDFDNASSLIATAREFPVEFNASTGIPDQLEKMLNARRNAVNPVASPAQEALKLMSQAQLAFDRKQYNDAMAFVSDAKKINAGPEAFTNGVPQPWQLEMKIEKALSAVTQFDANVRPTQMVDGDGLGKVSTAQYDPSADTTRNVAVSLNDDANGFAAKQPAKLPSTAIELYRAGVESIREGNTTEAKNYMTRAWEGRASLDPSTQQSLQDQLLKLTQSEESKNNFATLASQNQPLQRNLQEQDLEAFRTLQKEVFSDRAAAERLIETSPREALEKMSMIRNRIGQSSLDAKQQRPLLLMIDRDMSEVQAYIDQNVSTIENDETNARRKEFVELRRQRKLDVQQQMLKLVEEYNKLVDEERFAEASMVAKQAYELAPETEIATMLREKASFLQRDYMNNQLLAEKEQGVWQSLYSVDQSGIPWDDRNTMIVGDAERFAQRGAARSRRMEESRYGSPAEANIWNKLKNEQVQGEYRGTLAEAVEQLAAQSGLNIIFDQMALNSENILTDSPVSVPITSPISLRSALQIVLDQKGLVFVVENEVVKITSRTASSAKLGTKTYYIGDLVMPMAPPQNPYQMEFMQPRMLGAMGGSMNIQHSAPNGARNQIAMSQQLGGLQPGSPFGGMNYGGYGSDSPQMGQPTYATVGQKPLGGVTIQDFQPLIQLIRGTIEPDSWDGGTGSGQIFPYAQNLSLVVSNTQEVQDQIQDLLSKLRELNDVQIVVEVRFVTLQDDFFERVGIDFDFNINDSNSVDPNADVQSSSGIIGQQPIDSNPFLPTSNGDIQFLQGNFAAAEPLFGGFNGGASAATIGFAILSDIEVFFLLSAAKGNVRTNITQAPTVTMFNGQSANINDSAQRPFVTSVVPVVGDFAVAHQPIITLLPDGTNLNVTAVVSADRKYVRLQLVPFFSQVTEVNTFTFDGSQRTERTTNSVLDDLLDIVNGGANADDTNEELQTTTQGITVQLPTLASTTVSTVVSVPDGGTVLMGGIKRMSEGRTESGVPFLSSLPYVNRLFKNVAIGHETNHLMMMVTPRIIIQREIEEDQVGLAN